MRLLLAALLAAMFAATAAAQTQPKRLAYVGNQPRNSSLNSAMEERLRQLGWRDGETLIIAHAQIRRPDEYAEALRRITATGVDIVVAPGTEQALVAAKTVTQGVPIVFLAINYDPVARGHIASLARPGGRLTGVFMQQTEFTAKRVEMLHETFPAARSLVILWDSYGIEFLAPSVSAAERLGVVPRPIRVDDFGRELEAAFREAVAANAPVLLLGSPIFFRERNRIGELGRKLGVPIIGVVREHVEAGALLHLGPNLPELFSRTADYVDKVLKGADPAVLPVEQPTHFEITVNLRTARALGIKLPISVLARADGVIE